MAWLLRLHVSPYACGCGLMGVGWAGKSCLLPESQPQIPYGNLGRVFPAWGDYQSVRNRFRKSPCADSPAAAFALSMAVPDPFGKSLNGFPSVGCALSLPPLWVGRSFADGPAAFSFGSKDSCGGASFSPLGGFPPQTPCQICLENSVLILFRVPPLAVSVLIG